MIRDKKYIQALKYSKGVQKSGNKAWSVWFLRRNNFRVPLTYVVSSEAYDDYRTHGDKIIEQLKAGIMLLPDKEWAIRSSTNTEDSLDSSFAGLFQTLTNIRGVENIVSAIVKVWESTTHATVDDYRARTGSKTTEIKCAVMIQEMVRAVFSGVSFSQNPVTGLNETVIEAVEGLGEDLVQKGITPLRWRLRKSEIIEGDKDHRYFKVISEVAGSTAKLKKIYHENVDIEWVYDGTEVYYLQVRSVTGRRDINIYSNRMAREMLPGQVKPLVWSVNIPLVNGTWLRLLSEITGTINTQPEELAKPFYYRAYFNMIALGKLFREFGFSAESLEFMMIDDRKGMPGFRPGLRTLKHTGRIIRFIWNKIHFEPFFLKEYPVLKKEFESLREKIRMSDPVSDFRSLYDELFREAGRLVYLNIMVPILMQIYNKRLRSKLKKTGYDYDLLTFIEEFPELKNYSPVYLMNEIRNDMESLPAGIKEKCVSFGSLSETPEASEVLNKIRKFISIYGHHSSSGNDISYAKWEEDPELVYSMIMGSQPNRTHANKLDFSMLKYSSLRYPMLRKAYFKAGRFRLYREMISSLYIYGYGQFRLLFLRTGKELAERRIIDQPDDIFYLYKEEVENILAETVKGQVCEVKELILSRKKEMTDCENIALPTVIYGDEAPLPETGNIKNLKGIGTSPGTFRGKTRIVRGTWDFGSVRQGDVIIIPFSDVSWSPVLLKAGAIVSESGGMLSHCSILARETGIPSMVSVDYACMLPENIEVSVNGSNGILTIH